MICLVGSRALRLHQPDLVLSQSADVDFISDGTDQDNSLLKSISQCADGKLDVIGSDVLNNKEVVEKYSVNYGEKFSLMSMKGLAIMKRSHLWKWDKWDSNITVYHKRLKPFVTFDQEDLEVLSRRVELTKKEFPQRHPTLNKTNSDFFDDFVTKKFDHDWLHELVAFYGEPLYTRLKHDEKKDLAWCEKDLWDSLSLEDKNKCVAEEAHVIACERYMIPSDWKTSTKHAYYSALKKVCTTLTSGWFRDHSLEEFPAIYELHNTEIFDKVKAQTLTA